jgi:hypothetical protein
MNRRKKVNQILKKRAKQKNEKLYGKTKPAYIPKAEREAAAQTSPTSEPLHDDAS